MFKRGVVCLFILLSIVTFANKPVEVNASECGLSCCIAGAAEGIGAGGRGFYVGLQYEWMKMGTLLEGTRERNSGEALSSYMMVPDKMIMQKMTANIAYGFNERASLLVSIPYVKNEMDMFMKKMMPMTVMKMEMDDVEGVGDVTVMGVFKLYADRDMAPTKRLSFGIGLKTPTGRDDERNDNGSLVHMMMQPGTGSWDPVFVINGMKAFGKNYLLGTATYQYTTENNRGYEVGDRLSIDITGKRRMSDLLNLALALNYVHTERDQTDGSGNYQNAMSMVDNVKNTGLDAYFLTPAVEFKPSAGSRWNFKVSARIPVHQDVNGMQLVTDDWYVINAGYRF